MPVELNDKDLDDLTLDEIKIIQSLHRISLKWPQSLTLIACHNRLDIVRTDEVVRDGDNARTFSVVHLPCRPSQY